MVKRVLIAMVPAPLLVKIWKIPLFLNITVTHILFLLSKKKTQRLNWEDLDELEKLYYVPPNELTLQNRIE